MTQSQTPHQELPEFDFHHGGVSVPNLETAITWYGDMLGFELEHRFSIDAAKAEVAMLRRGPLRFELFEVQDAATLPESRRTPSGDLSIHGNKHVAFAVNDFDSLLVYLRDNNADIALLVQENFGSSCFIRDCFGNLIEFVKA